MSNNEPNKALVGEGTTVDCEVVKPGFHPDSLVDVATGEVVEVRGHVVGRCSRLLTSPDDGAVIIKGDDGSLEIHW